MKPHPPLLRVAFAIPVFAVLFLALFPQLYFVAMSPRAWNGAYFVSNYDEPAYSAYVNALINGKPRKNDPFVPALNPSAVEQPETLYSVQFIPAYAIALPARLLGLDVSTAFNLLACFIAVFSALSLYRLFVEVTGDRTVAAVGPITVLCLGTVAAFQGELRNLVDGRVLADFLPFLRRYQPGFGFPLFFVFCVLACRAARAEDAGRTARNALGAGLIFAILVFSYFYLWTAAAAWLACYLTLSVILNRMRFKRAAIVAGAGGVISAMALGPYFYLLSHRSPNLDSVQLLTFTHLPEFASPSMFIGIIIAAASFLVFRARNDVGPLLPLILAFALTPTLLFNQQVITGRSLQPVHYELFIANYMVLTAAILLLAALRRFGSDAQAPNRWAKAVVYLGIVAFGWGFFEAYGSTTRNFTPAEIRDASLPALQAAQEVAAPVVLATNFVTADFIPSVGNSRPLWNPHSSSAGGLDVKENKLLFYRYLYFSGYGERDLESALNANSFETTAAIFGSERALPLLAGEARKITQEDIKAEVAKFAEFAKAINASDALSPVITHLIVPTEAEGNLMNIDRWYERDPGRDFGLFRLYRLTPKARR